MEIVFVLVFICSAIATSIILDAIKIDNYKMFICGVVAMAFSLLSV